MAKLLISLHGREVLFSFCFIKISAENKRGIRTVQTIPYQLKFNTKIGRYPAMSFMVMRLEKEIFRGVFGIWKNIYDGSFSKIGEIEI